MLLRFAAACLAALVTSHTLAAPETHSYHALVDRVHAPNVIRVIPEGHNEHFYFEMVDLAYGDIKNIACTRMDREEWQTEPPKFDEALTLKAKDHCRQVAWLLKGEYVEIQITDWSKPVLKGYVVIHDEVMNYAFIENGVFRADPQQTRSAAPYLKEREARCNFRGLWSDLRGNSAEQLKCEL